MSEPRIYSGAEALALREAAEHPIAPTHTHTLTLTTGETALLHAAPGLAASVAHHEAAAATYRLGAEMASGRLADLERRVYAAEPELDRWRNAIRACAARCDAAADADPEAPAGVDALVAVVIDALAHHEARTQRAEADRDAALAHAAELERALRVVRSTVEREADGALALRAERNALRAIIEGRTVPPTDAEVYAHGGPGRSGWWLVSSPDDMSLELIEQPKERDWCIEWGATQWLPIGLDGRPCAWPVVPEAHDAR